jgi:hypothetical protein
MIKLTSEYQHRHGNGDLSNVTGPLPATEKYLQRFPAIAEPRRRTYAAMLSEKRDLAAEEPAELAALKKPYEAWSAEVDADCRRLGIEPPMPKAPRPDKQGRKAAKSGAND